MADRYNCLYENKVGSRSQVDITANSVSEARQKMMKSPNCKKIVSIVKK